MDAHSASYGIEDYRRAAVNLAQTTMRAEIGKMSLGQTFAEREALNFVTKITKNNPQTTRLKISVIVRPAKMGVESNISVPPYFPRLPQGPASPFPAPPPAIVAMPSKNPRTLASSSGMTVMSALSAISANDSM